MNLKLTDLPSGTLYEFLGAIIIATLIAGGGVYLACVIVGPVLSTATARGDVAGFTFFKDNLLWAVPMSVFSSAAMAYLHSHLFMSAIRQQTSDEVTIGGYKRVSWQYVCTSCLISLATAITVFIAAKPF